MNNQLSFRLQVLAGVLLAMVALYAGMLLGNSTAPANAAAVQQEIGTQAITYEAVFNYEGVLRYPDGGTLFGGAYDLEVSLYSQASGGSAVWTDTFNGVMVRNGRFNVVLGSQNALGSELDITPMYVGIRVNGEEFGPREELLRVPWAFYAKAANYANNVDYATNVIFAESTSFTDDATYADNIFADVTDYSISTNDQFDVSTNLTSWQNNTDGAMCWLTGVHVTSNSMNTNCYIQQATRTLHTAGFSTCQAQCFNYGN